jgi:hypothetical protein
MWSSKAFLERCAKLKEHGLEVEFEIGSRLARGFADVGFEEFYLLSGSKLVSIFSAHTSTLTPEHRGFFFLVPDADILVNEIEKRGFDVASLEFRDQRTWVVCLRHAGTGKELQAEHRESLCCLAQALLLVLAESK